MFRPSSLLRLKTIRGFASDAAKLRLNFTVPHQTIAKDQVIHQVNLQTTSGDMGVLVDHVPSISQLNFGSVVEIIPADSAPVTKYFVSGGFAVINPDSTLNINAIEAFPISDIDATRKELEEATRKASATNLSESDRALARIEQELYEAVLNAAK